MTSVAAPSTARSEQDPRAPVSRVAALVDDGTAVVRDAPDDVAVRVADGRVHGAPVVVFCTDATRRGGSLGLAECVRIADAIDEAHRRGVPVIGIWHSGGARLTDGVESMHGIGLVFAATVRASGRVLQVSLVLGPAAGGAAYGPALTDVVVMAPAARVFVTGPDIVRSVTGEEIDMESLGGPDAHGRRSGVAHVAADSEEDAVRRTRRLVELVGRPGRFAPPRTDDGRDPSGTLPASARRAYDVHPVIDALLDESDPLFELHARWSPNVVTGLGRLAGATVGVLANNPIRKGGCLDATSAEKAARFVRMCDAFGVPILSLVDVPGFLPGVGEEHGGVVRRGAKLLYAFAEASVPRVTLVTRKSYGGAYIAMNSRSLGADAIFAWPDAEIAVMGAESAVGVLHRRELAAAAEGADREDLRRVLVERQTREAGGTGRALSLGVVDEIVAPLRSRRRLAETFCAVSRERSPVRARAHGNIPL